MPIRPPVAAAFTSGRRIGLHRTTGGAYFRYPQKLSVSIVGKTGGGFMLSEPRSRPTNPCSAGPASVT